MNDLTILSEKSGFLIAHIQQTIKEIRKQHFNGTARMLRHLIYLLSDYINLAANVLDKPTFSTLLSYLKELNETQQTKDYVLLGDILELKLLPFFYDIQATLLSNISYPYKEYFDKNLSFLEENSELYNHLKQWKKTFSTTQNTYIIEPTGTGFATLKKSYHNTYYYFHSNQNPYEDGSLFTISYAEDDVLDYTILGLGLGYHVIRFLAKDERFRITVLEPDLNIIGLAFTFTDLSYLLSQKRFQLIYSTDLKELRQCMQTEDSKFIIHYPSMMTMENETHKKLLEDYFLQMNSIEEQKSMLRTNFYYNRKKQDKPADTLKHLFENKTVIYLGGGPSTETKLPQIKDYISAHPDSISICAGKVYRKLLAENFIPDFVIITDASPWLSWQLSDIPQTNTSLLYLSTASKNAVNAFCGNRYIFFQQGYPESEAYALTNHLMMVETGGSVSTCAIDFALQMKCNKLITVGLDLAYPNSDSHAFGILGKVPENTPLVNAKDLHGNQISTTAAFLIYKKWFENRFKKTPVKCFNLTNGLAIDGMYNCEHFPESF